MKIQPLHDRVLIRRIAENNTTKSGLIIPDSAAEKSLQGKIIAIGSGKIDNNGKVQKLAVKVGDTVLFTQYGSSEVKVNNEVLLVMREDDIQAIIK